MTAKHPATRQLYSSFGNELADLDLARTQDDIDQIFLETQVAKRFLADQGQITFVVGTRGSGKSLLLFKKYIEVAKNKAGVILAPGSPAKAFMPGSEFATGVAMSNFWKLLRDGKPFVAGWAQLWETALLGALAEAWKRQFKTAETASPAQKDFLTRYETDHAKRYRRNPYDSISDFLSTIEIHKKGGKPELPTPTDLRELVMEHVNDFPPVYFFIDQSDEYYENEPDFWIASSLGAIRAIQQIRRITNHRIHFAMSLRKEIKWELQKQENFASLQSGMIDLEWDGGELMHLFVKRAELLDPELLYNPELRGLNPLAAFAGKKFLNEATGTLTVHNLLVKNREGHPAEESMAQYILRHTFGRPRDLIIIGNRILELRQTARTSDFPRDREAFREAIDHAASCVIAKSYIAEVKHRWPSDWKRVSDDPIVDFFRKFIHRNVITRDEAVAIQRQFADDLGLFAEETHPLCYLAAFGLVGWPYRDPGSGRTKQHFHRPGAQVHVHLPKEVKYLLIHPCLYAHPFGDIRPIQQLVVGPGCDFDCDLPLVLD